MFYLKTGVTDWPQAVDPLPDLALFKSHEVQRLAETAAHNAGVWCYLRYWNDPLQVVSPDDTDAIREARARDWFNRFIDGTFLDGESYGIEHWNATDIVQWWNEYYANSQSDAEKELWWRQERVAARIWRDEYRNGPHADKLGHIRLAIASAPVGNDIPWQSAETAVKYDAILDYHGYDKFLALKQRDPLSWRYHCGRWDTMDQQFRALGYTCNWVLGEAGPYEGVYDGWRSGKVLGADPVAYVEAVRTFIREIRGTNAYQTGRFLGFALFVSGGGDKWKLYETGQPELDKLAAMIAEEWVPVEPAPEPVPAPVPAPTTKPVFIIDTSRWQGVIDWPKAYADLRARILAAYPDEPDPRPLVAMRATVGDYYLDPMFEINWEQAGAVGFLRTAYHVVSPKCDADAQMSLFGEAVCGKALDDRPVLDCEKHDDLMPDVVGASIKDCTMWVTQWFAGENELLISPYCYTARWFWDAYVKPVDIIAGCPLWVADYSTGATSPLMPSGFNFWGRWQFTSKGVVAGITENTVDLSYYWLDYATFRSVLRPCRFDYEPEPVEPEPPAPEPVEPSPIEPSPVQPVEPVPVEQRVVYVTAPSDVLVKVRYVD